MPTAKIGVPFWISLCVKDAYDMFGVSGYINYDPNELEASLFAGAPVVESFKFFGDNEKVRVGLLNGAQGRLGFVITRPGEVVGVAGAGIMMRMSMIAKPIADLKPGETRILKISGMMVKAVSPEIVVVDGVAQNRILPSRFTGVDVAIENSAAQVERVIEIYLTVGE